ncbi:MAG: hypothetical protein A3G20_05105 [Acidobacteria bacterium RIFCSPLOWO2_12_FULL_59_11]|nr:MAG: hypothetical protein A3G20_05105 [Acidobacteria bacterium RIFCSPLOWO2_12_FULL_59_11]
MLNILASGTLVSDPRQRTTAGGKAFATGQMRVPAEDADPMLVSVIAFNADAVQALLALAKGDSCAIAGRAKLTSWEKDGEQRHGLSVTADQVLTIYQIEKRRKRAAASEEVTA